MKFNDFLAKNESSKLAFEKSPFGQNGLTIQSIQDEKVSFVNGTNCSMEDLINAISSNLGYVTNPEMVKDYFKKQNSDFDVSAYLDENVPYRCYKYLYLEDKNVIYAICETEDDDSLFYIDVANDTCINIYDSLVCYNTILMKYDNAAYFLTIYDDKSYNRHFNLQLFSLNGKKATHLDTFTHRGYMSVEGMVRIDDRFRYCTLHYEPEDRVDKIVIVDLKNKELYPIHTKRLISSIHDVYTTLNKKYIEYSCKRIGGNVLKMEETDGKIVLDFELFWKDGDGCTIEDHCGHGRVKIFKDERPAIMYHVNIQGEEQEMYA
jgi:hypothetical protein